MDMNARKIWAVGFTFLVLAVVAFSSFGFAAQKPSARFFTGLVGEVSAQESIPSISSSQTSTILIGNSLTGLDNSAKGGIQFRGYNDANHTVPFALELSQNTSGSVFQFDGRTIWYQENFGTNPAPSVGFDYNFGLSSGDYVNDRNWTFNTPALSGGIARTRITIEGIGAFDVAWGSVLKVDNVYYKISSLSADSPRILVAVDGAITFRKNNSTGPLVYNTKGNPSSSTYGKLFFSENNVFDATPKNMGGNQNTILEPQKNLGLPGNGDKKFYYAVLVNTVTNRLWLLLDAHYLGKDESNQIQYGKQIEFAGTEYPFNGLEMPTASYSYYIPKGLDADFNAVYDQFKNPESYFIARVIVKDKISTGDITVWLDTNNAGNLGPFPNNNISNYSQDAYYAGKMALSLTSGSDPAFKKEGTTDGGTTISLRPNDAGVKIVSPKSKVFVPTDNTAVPDNADCRDTDKGIYSAVKGALYDGAEKLYEDTCVKTQLREFYCASKVRGMGSVSVMINCPGGCLDGACVQTLLKSDLTVKEINAGTKDVTVMNNGIRQTYREGGIISNLDGAGKYTGKKLALKITSVLPAAPLRRPAATASFELYNPEGKLILNGNTYSGINLKEIFDANTSPEDSITVFRQTDTMTLLNSKPDLVDLTVDRINTGNKTATFTLYDESGNKTKTLNQGENLALAFPDARYSLAKYHNVIVSTIGKDTDGNGFIAITIKPLPR